MLSVRAGIDTFRYWRSARQIAEKHESRVAADALAKLRKVRPEAGSILSVIRRDGVAVVPNYWSAEKCVVACAEINRLIGEFPAVVQQFSGGSDKRMFGVEAVSALLNEFHDDPFLREVGEVIGGHSLDNFATLGARIDATSENNGSGDGWHRDAHGYQFKSILYLCDVTEDNGPFEYLPGSHKDWRAALDTTIGNLPPAPASRYESAAIDRMVRRFRLNRTAFPAKAGTLLLVNTSGIHRGRPLRSGTRYALTNYFYHPHQVSEERIRNFPPLMPGAAKRVRTELQLR